MGRIQSWQNPFNGPQLLFGATTQPNNCDSRFFATNRAKLGVSLEINMDHRIRIRFSKEGDLRLISHRDLMRLVERLLRRANLPLAMTQGFHPKARIRFASALGLGIQGANEWVEIHLSEEIDASAYEAVLRDKSPPGFVIHEAVLIPPTEGKLAANASTFEVVVPPELREIVAASIRRWETADTWPIERAGRATPLDLIHGVERLELDGEVFRMVLRMNVDGSIRPREAVAAVGLGDLIQHGLFLARASMEIATR